MKKNRVVVLDSDFGAAESVASLCRAEGMLISRATDGRAALEMFLIERPDAIILSALPRDPGDFNICAAIAKDANPVPIIALVTPNEDEAFRRGRPRPSGITAFLVKPFRYEELRALFQCVFVPPEIVAKDEELDGVLAALNPKKPGSANAPSPPSAPAMVQVPAPPVSAKPAPSPAPARVRVPAKNRPESVDSIVADILADVGIEKKQKKVVIPENRGPRPIKPRPNPPRPPAGDPLIAVPKDVEKLPELETFPPTIDKSFGGLYKEAKKKPGIKSLAIAAGLTLAVTALIYSGLRKKMPSPITPQRSSPVSGVVPASLQKEPNAPDPTAPESSRGEIEKKPFAPLPKPAPKEAPGAETKPSAAAQKPTIPDDPAVSKSINLDRIPGFGLQTREISDIPTKPAETIPPPVTTPAKDVPPAVKMGQWVPLDQVDVQPQLTSSVKAVYPPPMMQRKIEGQLRFSVLISESGDVLKADLMPAPTDNLEFEAAARAALLKRKYKPALKDGVPVQVSMPINVVFKLNR